MNENSKEIGQNEYRIELFKGEISRLTEKLIRLKEELKLELETENKLLGQFERLKSEIIINEKKLRILKLAARDLGSQVATEKAEIEIIQEKRTGTSRSIRKLEEILEIKKNMHELDLNSLKKEEEEIKNENKKIEKRIQDLKFQENRLKEDLLNIELNINKLGNEERRVRDEIDCIEGEIGQFSSNALGWVTGWIIGGAIGGKIGSIAGFLNSTINEKQLKEKQKEKLKILKNDLNSMSREFSIEYSNLNQTKQRIVKNLGEQMNLEEYFKRNEKLIIKSVLFDSIREILWEIHNIRLEMGMNLRDEENKLREKLIGIKLDIKNLKNEEKKVKEEIVSVEGEIVRFNSNALSWFYSWFSGWVESGERLREKLKNLKHELNSLKCNYQFRIQNCIEFRLKSWKMRERNHV